MSPKLIVGFFPHNQNKHSHNNLVVNKKISEKSTLPIVDVHNYPILKQILKICEYQHENSIKVQQRLYILLELSNTFY